MGSSPAPFDAQFLRGRLHIGQAGEIQADGCAAACSLRPGRHALVLDGLGRLGKIGLQSFAIGVRLDLVQLALPHRAREIAPDDLAQRFVFKNFGTRFHNPTFAKPFSITPSVPSVMRKLQRSARRTHSTRHTSSPGRSAPLTISQM